MKKWRLLKVKTLHQTEKTINTLKKMGYIDVLDNCEICKNYYIITSIRDWNQYNAGYIMFKGTFLDVLRLKLSI